MANPLSTNPAPYEVPSWAGKPDPGLHLDVTKEGKLIQKLLIDEKKCYYFGRNPSLCDFQIDHESCSRVHAAIVWHRHLERAFLVDLGSAHGTYIGSKRLEPKVPTQLITDILFHFGASSRRYTLRERPKTISGDKSDTSLESSGVEISHSSLPDNEDELARITEFNTNQNMNLFVRGALSGDKLESLDTKIAGPQLPDDRNQRRVSFNDHEEIINLEDIDPSVGKFRNLVQTSTIVIPRKAPANSVSSLLSSNKRPHPSSTTSPSKSCSSSSSLYHPTIGSKLGFSLPNPAPDLNSDSDGTPSGSSMFLSPKRDHYYPDSAIAAGGLDEEHHLMNEPKKKKYVKEAWPGRKPTNLLM